jgi:hypothetical protein
MLRESAAARKNGRCKQLSEKFVKQRKPVSRNHKINVDDADQLEQQGMQEEDDVEIDAMDVS